MWSIIAIDGDTGELLAIVSGERTLETLRLFVEMLDRYEYENVYTDDWKPYTTVFSKKDINHFVGKDGTYRIESVNNEIRQRCGSYVRKTNGVTQSIENNSIRLKCFSYYRFMNRNNQDMRSIMSHNRALLREINDSLKLLGVSIIFTFLV